MMSKPSIEAGETTDLDSFVDLLEGVASWLWGRGVRQWEPGSMRAQRPLFERLLAQGALLVARDGAGLLGGAIVTRHATSEWEGRTGPALYLHKLAVVRTAAGTGLGDRLLDAAAAWTQAQSVPVLRLDCWDGNETLKAYYRARAFSELDAVPSNGYEVRLFERRVVPS